MQLIVSGLASAPTPFKHLWGRYVTGFRPWHHCIPCFECKVAKGISAKMGDGPVELDPTYDLFYLCGVGQLERTRPKPHQMRRATNVHLAVRPLKGSVAAVGSVYGVTFVITDAEAIPIAPLPPRFKELPDGHWSCKNFQFGYQMFAADAVGKQAPREVIHTRRA